jgi:hypothetical protein
VELVDEPEPAEEEVAVAVVVAQVIDVDYDKAARGGAGATARARIPRSAPLADHDGHTLHEHRLAFADGYTPRTAVRRLALRDGRATIGRRFIVQAEADRLIVSPAPGAETWQRKPILELPVGRWGRVRWNERRGTFDEHWFGDVVMNVGLFRDTPPANVFRGRPAAEHDARLDLLRNAYRVRR